MSSLPWPLGIVLGNHEVQSSPEQVQANWQTDSDPSKLELLKTQDFVTWKLQGVKRCMSLHLEGFVKVQRI